jgi:hypothetical protein
MKNFTITTMLFLLLTILFSCGKPITKPSIEGKPSYYKFNNETINIDHALMIVTNEKGEIHTTVDNDAKGIKIKLFFYDTIASLGIYDSGSEQKFIDEWKGVFLDSTDSDDCAKCKDFVFTAKNESFIIIKVINNSEILSVEIKAKENEDRVVFSTSTQK